MAREPITRGAGLRARVAGTRRSLGLSLFGVRVARTFGDAVLVEYLL